MTEPTDYPVTDADELVLLQHPTILARAVLRALAVAGAQTDWDAQTVEDVLEPLNSYAVRAGLPTAVDAAAPGALQHWRAVADELGVEHDGPTAADDDELEA